MRQTYSAIRDAKEAIAITEEMQQTFVVKNGGSPDPSATKYRKADLKSLENNVEIPLSRSFKQKLKEEKQTLFQ